MPRETELRPRFLKMDDRLQSLHISKGLPVQEKVEDYETLEIWLRFEK
jgi:hypothetical protein